MTSANANQPVSQEIRVEIIRADGTVEDLGLVAAGYADPVKQAHWNIIGQRLASRRTKRFNANNRKRAN